MGNKAGVFGLGIVAVSGLDLLEPGSRAAALCGLLIGLIFAVAGFSAARGHRRPLLAIPVLLALSALSAVAAAGPVVIPGAVLVVGLAFRLWRTLTRSGMLLFPDDLS